MTGLLRKQQPLRWCSLQFGRNLPPESVQQLVLSVLSGRHFGTVVFEAESAGSQLSYRVGCAYPERLSEVITQNLPDVYVAHANRCLPDTGTAVEVRLNTHRRPLDGAHPEGTSARILDALRSLGGGQTIYQVVVGDRLRPNAIPRDIEAFESESWAGALLEAAWSGTKRLDPDARRALADKEGQPGARVNLRLLCGGDSDNKSRLAAFEAALRSIESPGVQIKLVRSDWSDAAGARPARRSTPLNLIELYGVLAWPLGEHNYPGLDRSGAQLLAATCPEATHRIIGVGTHPARRNAVGISAEDALRHTHVIGPTGVGKSTLLLHMIEQDIADGRGVVVLDPKGDLIDDVLERVSPRDLDRVVILDPARTDHIVGFNPLAVHKFETELAVDGILHSFQQLHSDSWGPRTQDILHNALLTLAGTPWASLCFIPALLTDTAFQKTVLASRPLPTGVEPFWAWVRSTSPEAWAAATAPLLTKLRPFVLRSSLRGLLGQVEPSFALHSVFSERKVLLVPLRKGQIGPVAANLLGSLLVARLWQVTLQRSGIATGKRHPVMLYLDEFQDYLKLPADFADILAQARGLGVGMILAHQHLGQLGSTTRTAVLANAQNRVTFRLSAEDAQLMARISPELEATDFASIGRYEAYARLLRNGQMDAPVSIRTLPPGKTLRRANKAAEQIARRWGTSLSEVDSHLASTANQQPAEPAPGRRKRGPQ